MFKLRLVQGGKGKRKRYRYPATRRPVPRRRRQGGGDVGAWVHTAGQVQGEIARVFAKAKLLNIRIMSPNSGASENMRGEFLSWYKGFLKFRKDNTGYWDKFAAWSAQWDQIVAWRQEANRWVVRAAKLGVLSRSEAMPVEEGVPWGNIFWGVGLLLGFFIWQKSKG